MKDKRPRSLPVIQLPLFSKRCKLLDYAGIKTTQSSEDDTSSSDSLNSSVTDASLEDSDVCSRIQHDAAQQSSGREHSQGFTLLHNTITRLDELNPSFNDVRGLFLAGLGMMAAYTTVTGISKNCHRSTSGHVRYHVFRQQEEITKRMRGNANIRHGWYGTSKQGVSSIILHGFGQPKATCDAMYGVGIYLAPEKYSHVSALYADVDENGEQHVVLCRAIMGNMEQVACGTEQFHPRSEAYDAGVDDLSNPKRYIVWSTHMNTHILPEYVVSFKLEPPCQRILSKLRRQKFPWRKVSTERDTHTDAHITGKVNKVEGNGNTEQPRHGPPRSPWMTFPMLFMLMKTKLPQDSMDRLQQHYVDFKAERISRSAFIKIVRSVAGDKLVGDSIKSMQTQAVSAVLVQNLLTSGRGQVVNNAFIL